jgi:hypothetical protein
MLDGGKRIFVFAQAMTKAELTRGPPTGGSLSAYAHLCTIAPVPETFTRTEDDG